MAPRLEGRNRAPGSQPRGEHGQRSLHRALQRRPADADPHGQVGLSISGAQATPTHAAATATGTARPFDSARRRHGSGAESVHPADASLPPQVKG